MGVIKHGTLIDNILGPILNKIPCVILKPVPSNSLLIIIDKRLYLKLSNNHGIRILPLLHKIVNIDGLPCSDSCLVCVRKPISIIDNHCLSRLRQSQTSSLWSNEVLSIGFAIINNVG